MHLAIVSPYPPSITGIGQYGYHLSRILAKSELFTDITVLTSASDTERRIAASHPIHIKPTWQPNNINAGWRVTSELQRLQPDLVWFNLGASIFGRSPLANLSGFLSPVMGRRLGFPSILTLHELIELADLQALKTPGGPLAACGARLLTRLALQADVVCLTIRHYAEWLSAHHPYRQYVHIPLGAYYSPEKLPESTARELLFFTTLAPFKGLEVLLQAFKILQFSYPDLRLTIAGAEHARFPEYARSLQERFGGITGVRWLGQIPEAQVRTIFQRAQIVVLPYNASTGSSSVLCQASMWGRPVVVSDLPEIQSVVRESGLGVTYFERGNVTSLVTAIRAQLDSPQRRQAQVEHNFAAIKHNKPEETCRAYLQAFNLALENQRSPKRITLPAQVTLES